MYTADINGVTLLLETSPGLFSPSGADAGTLAMLSETDIAIADGPVLDLGCGCGIVGIYAAKILGEDKVTMCDISEEAVNISAQNAAANGVPGVRIYISDGLKNLPEGDFSLILSNPPYHTDFSVAKGFIEDGYRRLKTNGRMVITVKRFDWYRNKLKQVFGGVRVAEKDGYYILTAEKRPRTRKPVPKEKSPGLSKKLAKKYKKRV